MRSLTVCFIMSLWVFPATAQTAPASSAAELNTPVASAAVKPKQICRTEEVIGSHLGGHRECHSAAEWAAISRANSMNMDHNVDTRTVRPN